MANTMLSICAEHSVLAVRKYQHPRLIAKKPILVTDYVGVNFEAGRTARGLANLARLGDNRRLTHAVALQVQRGYFHLGSVMNVDDFAERIVFGTTLAEKLQAAPELTYEPRSRSAGLSGFNIGSIASPARPSGLELNQNRKAAKPPSAAKLDNNRERGRLLHFLANHELLATELMALVLLKFPDAPEPFRRGIVHTLKEEQRHTRMYLARMRQCGIEFGSYPLSGHFWRMVEPMQSPLDFVSRLSLTFEQANLDYSLHFAKLFGQVGDQATANLLQQVYRDEISHVRHGLHWFRQWKSPAQSDFDAWSSRLVFPMSPERARGPNEFFNRAGRYEAGLDRSFIDAVEVYRKSRGRTPDIHWFNPSAESELNSHPTSRESQLLEQIGKDLEWLMLFDAKPDDAILVRQVPATATRQRFLEAKLKLPEFVCYDQLPELAARKLHRFCPWAWTPSAHAWAKELRDGLKWHPPAFRAEQTDLYRKSFTTKLLRHLHDLESQQASDPPVIQEETLGAAVESIDDVRSALTSMAWRGYPTAIVKADLATSGRGQRRLRTSGLIREDLKWLNTMLESGQGGVVEPELKRVLDLSFLWNWRADEERPRFEGWTRCRVSPGRRYAGTFLGRFLDSSETELSRYLLADSCRRLHQAREWLEERLVPEFQRRGLRTPFGVDAWVYLDRKDRLQLKTLGELNPRTTMGHLALRIEKYLAPGIRGCFQILTRREYDELSDETKRAPLKFHRDGRWRDGVLVLSEPDGRTKLVPLIRIGSSFPPA